MHADANPFAAAEFADNPEPRCPCLLLLMSPAPWRAARSRNSTPA